MKTFLLTLAGVAVLVTGCANTPESGSSSDRATVRRADLCKQDAPVGTRIKAKRCYRSPAKKERSEEHTSELQSH